MRILEPTQSIAICSEGLESCERAFPCSALSFAGSDLPESGPSGVFNIQNRLIVDCIVSAIESHKEISQWRQ